MRRMLLDDPSCNADPNHTEALNYAKRAEALALALLPNYISCQLRAEASPQPVREALRLVGQCIQKCQLHLARRAAFAPKHAATVLTLGDLERYYSLLESDPTSDFSGLLLIPAADGDATSSPYRVRLDFDHSSPELSAVENDTDHHAIRDLCAELGYCERGEFGWKIVRGIISKCIHIKKMRKTEARQVPLADVAEFLRGIFAKHKEAKSSNWENPQLSIEDLSRRQVDFLDAMFILGATSENGRRTTEDIVTKATGSDAKTKAYREITPELKRLGLIDTKSSAGGGCWLTGKGRAIAEEIQNR
jgi:hypothetical protein